MIISPRISVYDHYYFPLLLISEDRHFIRGWLAGPVWIIIDGTEQ